ncbi:MAG: transporter rane protein [Myxococcaceae bacterium]|nr:transporter rane protein [Myxococcaceae bacterium]
MSGPLSLGWRNIWRNRRRTLISMSAIGVGLLLVIFYSGMVGGMIGEAKNQLDDAGMGHVEVFASGYRLRREVGRTMPDVRAQLHLPPGAQVGTRVLARGLATSARGNEPVQVFGVEWAEEAQLSAHLRKLTSGALPAAGDDRGVLIGEPLAERLALKVGSKVRLMVQRADNEMGADLFRVRGVYHSIAPAIGQRQVYVSAASARALIGIEGAAAHQVVVQLEDPAQADAVAGGLRAALGDRVEVLTWAELLPVLKRMEALTDNVVFAMAFFVYLLVGLGVLNTMLMSVLERTREFGVLMALGTRPSRIIQVVLAESFWIATLSVVLGSVLGSLLTWQFSRTGLRVNPAESLQLGGMIISTLVKTRFNPLDILEATAFVYAMALVVGLYPASRITRLQPAEALRRT